MFVYRRRVPLLPSVPQVQTKPCLRSWTLSSPALQAPPPPPPPCLAIRLQATLLLKRRPLPFFHRHTIPPLGQFSDRARRKLLSLCFPTEDFSPPFTASFAFPPSIFVFAFSFFGEALSPHTDFPFPLFLLQAPGGPPSWPPVPGAVLINYFDFRLGKDFDEKATTCWFLPVSAFALHV